MRRAPLRRWIAAWLSFVACPSVGAGALGGACSSSGPWLLFASLAILLAASPALLLAASASSGPRADSHALRTVGVPEEATGPRHFNCLSLHWWPFATGPHYGHPEPATATDQSCSTGAGPRDPSEFDSRSRDAEVGARGRSGVRMGPEVQERHDVIRMAVGSFSIHSPPPVPAELRGEPRDEGAYFIVHFRSAEAARQGRSALELEIRGAKAIDPLPRNAVVFRIRPGDVPALRAHPLVDGVEYYRPAYKLSPALEPLMILPGQEPPYRFRFAVTLFQPESLEETAERLRRLGAELPDTVENAYRKTAYIRLADSELSRLLDIAHLEAVRFIEPVLPYRTMNTNTDQVLQGGRTGEGTPYWDAGIRGAGQAVAMMDSGLDVDTIWFADSRTDAGTPGLSHRKVLSYAAWGGGTVGTCSCVTLTPAPGVKFSFSHGTLVAANIAANRQDLGLSDAADGMAPGARIHFQDIGNSSSILGTCDLGALFPPDDLTLPFQDALERGALVHDNSWGTGRGDLYTAGSGDVDQFLWSHPRFTVLFAAGDCGAGGGACSDPGSPSISTPGTAKNDITVGASDQDPRQYDVAALSSRGPETSGSGRVGPTLLMVGADSARLHPIATVNGAQDLGSDCKFGSGDCDITGPPAASCLIFGIEGTSHAAGYATGALLPARDYLAQGYFPTGAASPGDSIPAPSGPLLKALLVASAELMTGSGSGSSRFNNSQGYGRVQLTNVLPLAGDPRTPPGLALWDMALTAGLGATESARSHHFQVRSATREVRVSLAYYDPPSAAGSDGSLVNDLSLAVTDPEGNVYLGNSFGGAFSIRNGGAEDTRNPTEMVVISPAALIPGTYTATVRVGSGGILQDDPVFGGQPYALVASGDIAQLPAGGLGGVPGDVLNPGPPLTITLDGSGVTFSWSPSCLDQDYAVYKGNLADLQLGSTSRAALLAASTRGATTATDPEPGAAVYYLVVPNDGAFEGSYGQNSRLAERPPSLSSPYLQTLDRCSP